ncbi:hypothetical protein [Eupransor demetentiae]|uniref:Uncharacterized protein n=1 Tax=Eupransor demetentiae TaxID=3109584 RepID=A0ABP0EUB0_9LACO|nr:hypothetical protein R54876_GBNLAHCA_01407 [Lactobacillaceae bacterium LMG 33000]
MDQLDVAEDLQTVKDQVAILTARGFDVTEDQVMADALQRGLQEMVDERLGAGYDTVKWSDKQELQIWDMYNELVGTLSPQGDSLLDDFRQNDDKIWDYFHEQLRRIVSR